VVFLVKVEILVETCLGDFWLRTGGNFLLGFGARMYLILDEGS
jgi:hypothetical protein